MDWADEIAARLCNMDRDNREESHQVYLETATALRAAELRGRVAGMREAAELVREDSDYNVDFADRIRGDIYAAAAKLESSPTT